MSPSPLSPASNPQNPARAPAGYLASTVRASNVTRDGVDTFCDAVDIFGFFDEFCGDLRMLLPIFWLELDVDGVVIGIFRRLYLVDIFRVGLVFLGLGVFWPEVMARGLMGTVRGLFCALAVDIIFDADFVVCVLLDIYIVFWTELLARDLLGLCLVI
uniref:SFRICE_019658 n=1 Tax=Spodoptera frugiperda TaxID=7108 RepID=A0A2H1WN98_SPOFR